MKAEAKSAVPVKILDTEYSIAGYDDPEYLRRVANLVDRRMRLLEQKHRDLSPMKGAILTALNLADELLRTEKQLEQYQTEASQFSREISERSRKLVQLCMQHQK